MAWIKGDGIGPEVSEAALGVLEALEKAFGALLEIRFYEAGDGALRRLGRALPEETLEGFRRADAGIKGPVGDTAADVIVRMRIELDLYANVRPVRSYPGVPSVRSVDLVIVRENTEDLYKGIEFEAGDSAVAVRIISERASRRVARTAGKIALGRRGLVTIVHKANVLRKSCGLFLRAAREELQRMGVRHSDMLVDAAAMALVRDPERFDVILTTNMFGDILSDEAAQVAGSIGLAPSGNIGDEKAIFEPVHGAAPDIAGKGVANPYAMILSTAMMLGWLGSKNNDRRASEASKALERAVENAIGKGCLTPDAGGSMRTSEAARCVSKVLLEGA